jgi:ABC-2 type transport system ATP-binding protein
MLGVVQPTAGSIRVLGGDPQDVQVRQRIGYLPERLHLPGAWRPLEFLASVARLKQVKADERALRSQLSRVGLEGCEGRRIGGFSKGMRQRLGLAAALLGAPELLVLDEPTDGVDPLGRVEIRRLLAEELARGATLFLNSHLLSETERICGRVGVLSKGRLVREGPLEELRRAGPRWRARFSPGAAVDALLRAGFLATSTPDIYLCETSDVGALNAALDGARRGGAMIVELTREEKDLEGILTEALEAA